MTFAYAVTPDENFARCCVHRCGKHRAPPSRDGIWNRAVSIGCVPRMGHCCARHIRILRRYASFGGIGSCRCRKPDSVPHSCSGNKSCHSQALANVLFVGDFGLVRLLSRLSLLAVSGYRWTLAAQAARTDLSWVEHHIPSIFYLALQSLSFAAHSPGLRLALVPQIERHSSPDEIPEGRFIDLVGFVDVDGASDISVQAGVEQA